MIQEKYVMLASAIIVLLTLAVAPGAAQSGEDVLNETTTKPNDLVEKTDQLGKLTIHDYRADGDEFVITATWNGETPTSATVTEMVDFESQGSVKIAFKTIRLLPDSETEIRVPMQEPEGSNSVMLTTDESIEESNAIVLTRGESKSLLPVDPPQRMLYLAAAGTASAFVVAFFLIGVRAKLGEDSTGEKLA